MGAFQEGFDFFKEHSADFSGMNMGDAYVNTVNDEIEQFVKDLKSFEGTKKAVNQLKGDVAEFWHGDTFNIQAAVNDSDHRVQVDRSHDFGSVDVNGKNFDGKFGLKYYANGEESARQQAKSVFETFKKYQSGGGKETFDEYLKNRGYQDDSVLHDPVYSGQYRVIPSDQYNEAVAWLERKIKEETRKRPELVAKYQDTLKLLRDCVSDDQGSESIKLTEKASRELAEMAKKGEIDAKNLGLTTEELVRFEHIMKQAFHAGLTSATISLVLRTAPEIINAVKYLIDYGEIEEAHFKKIGFAALSGGAEGFVRGTVSASITAACESGMLGAALKGIDPTVIGTVTVLAMDAIKNAYKVSVGQMTRYEMVNELMKTMFTTSLSLGLGAAAQSLIPVPVLGYMLGSFVGSLVGSFTYDALCRPVISFCIDTGFTMFGLVDQNYTLPEDIIREIGVEVFDYDQFEYDRFLPEKFEYNKFAVDQFEPEKIEMRFLRRGVIAVNEIGFLE